MLQILDGILLCCTYRSQCDIHKMHSTKCLPPMYCTAAVSYTDIYIYTAHTSSSRPSDIILNAPDTVLLLPSLLLLLLWTYADLAVALVPRCPAVCAANLPPLKANSRVGDRRRRRTDGRTGGGIHLSGCLFCMLGWCWVSMQLLATRGGSVVVCTLYIAPCGNCSCQQRLYV